MKFYSNGPGQITKLTAMPFYDEIFLSRTTVPIALKPSKEHLGL